MAFQTPITIGKALGSIERREYVLPAIQREFVWWPEQIECLFDSLMRGYPIGSFLFWMVRRESIEKYKSMTSCSTTTNATMLIVRQSVRLSATRSPQSLMASNDSRP